MSIGSHSIQFAPSAIRTQFRITACFILRASISHTATLLANALASVKNVSILFCEFMSAQAVSCLTLQSALGINLRRYWINVNRIYAVSSPTQMIRMVRSRLNNLNEHLKSYAMCVPVPFSIKENTVAVLVYISSPKPARNSTKHYFRVNTNSSEEASENCAVNTKSVRIVVGHRESPKVNDGLGDVRLVPCAAFSF